jgi:[FeFe] hydrogenase H-cluster maturation GTPase HydF
MLILGKKEMVKGKENKPHIGIYGRRNVGKSSLINKMIGQEVSIVADFKGTTTDPVKKTFEIIGFGPVIFIDTAGIDDEGELGKLRTRKTLKTIDTIDLGIIVIADNEFGSYEELIIKELKNYGIPFFLIFNKSDVCAADDKLLEKLHTSYKVPIKEFSSLKETDSEVLLSVIQSLIPESSWKFKSMIGDLVEPEDIVLLITPIDIEAPEGRMILPQVQAIRDTLDNDCISIVLKENQVESFLRKTAIKPKLVITDSQVFGKIDPIIPKEIMLTGFSVMLAKHKGDFENYLIGTPKISQLKEGDKVLILESCSHHVACDDIGRFKIPRWLGDFTGKKLEYVVVSGLDIVPGNIRDYALVVQCGGCVITRKQIISRLKPAVDAGVPVTNYGMLIAYVHGIYDRAIAPFVEIAT